MIFLFFCVLLSVFVLVITWVIMKNKIKKGVKIMYTHFIEFIKSILSPIQDILKLISPNLGKIVAVCIVFLVALAVKRGVTH